MAFDTAAYDQKVKEYLAMMQGDSQSQLPSSLQYQTTQQQPVGPTIGSVPPVPGLAGSGLGATVAPIAGSALGAYLAAKGIQDAYKGKSGNTAARIQAGITTGGLSEALRLFGFGKPRTKVEDSRYAALQKGGITGFDRPFQATSDPHAWFRKDLAPDFMGYTDEKNKQGWVNNKFAKSRDVNDLRGDDLVGYSVFGEKYGNDWFGKYNDQQRRDIAQLALDNKAVSEGHGTVKVNWNPTLEEKIKSYLAGASSNGKK